MLRWRVCCAGYGLHQLVSHGDLPVERCAQLRRALLGGVVDVEEPETGAESLSPLEIVHQAPMEIAAHRHALGRRPLQLRQVAAQEAKAKLQAPGLCRWLFSYFVRQSASTSPRSDRKRGLA